MDFVNALRFGIPFYRSQQATDEVERQSRGTVRPWFGMIAGSLQEQQSLGWQLSGYRDLPEDATGEQRLANVRMAAKVEIMDVKMQIRSLKDLYADDFGGTPDYQRLMDALYAQMEAAYAADRAALAAEVALRRNAIDGIDAAVWFDFRIHVEDLRRGQPLIEKTRDVVADMWAERAPELSALFGFRPGFDGPEPSASDLLVLAQAAIVNAQLLDGEGAVFAERPLVGLPTEQRAWLERVVSVRQRCEKFEDSRERGTNTEAAISAVEQWQAAVAYLTRIAQSDFGVASELARDPANLDEFRLLFGARHYESGPELEPLHQADVVRDPRRAIEVAFLEVARDARRVLSVYEEDREFRDVDPGKAMSDAWATLRMGWTDLVEGCTRQIACVLEEHEGVRESLCERFQLPRVEGEKHDLSRRGAPGVREIQRLEARTLASSLVLEAGEGRPVDVRAVGPIPLIDGPDVERDSSAGFSVSGYFRSGREREVGKHSDAVANWNAGYAKRGRALELAQAEGQIVTDVVDRATHVEQPPGEQPVRQRRRRGPVLPDEPYVPEPLADGRGQDRGGTEPDDTQRGSRGAGDDDVRRLSFGVKDVDRDDLASGPAHPLVIEPGPLDRLTSDGDRPRPGRDDGGERSSGR